MRLRWAAVVASTSKWVLLVENSSFWIGRCILGLAVAVVCCGGRVMEYAYASRDFSLGRQSLKYALIGLKEIERLVRVPPLSIGSHEQFA